MTELPDDTYHQVIPQLFIGGRKLAKSLDTLQSIGVTHIVNATHEIRNYFEDEPLFRYVKADVIDSDQADLSPYFDQCADFIHEALTEGHGVLVHCQQGVSRSASIVLSYLIKHKEMKLSDAYMTLRKARAVAKPKPNFLKQLMAFEKRLAAAVAKPAAKPATAAGSNSASSASSAAASSSGDAKDSKPPDDSSSAVAASMTDEAASKKRKAMEGPAVKPASPPAVSVYAQPPRTNSSAGERKNVLAGVSTSYSPRDKSAASASSSSASGAHLHSDSATTSNGHNPHASASSNAGDAAAPEPPRKKLKLDDAAAAAGSSSS